MRIEDLRSEKRGNRARVAATVTWEDCDRPTQEVYFETDEAFAEGLSCNPHAFLVGCAIPALHYGERRIFVDAEICPDLRNGLTTAMGLVREWYYAPGRQLAQIEAKTKSDWPIPRTPGRAGVLFSGGIDSLAMLRANRLNYPLEHPSSIKDGLFIYGQNIESDNRPETFERAVVELSEVARDAGMTLIPVYTNVRLLDGRTEFFGRFHGAILAATAHAFARRLSTVFVASGSPVSTLVPHGSHPLLDPNYSSYDLRIRFDNILLTRLEKVKLVADWDVALQNIKVCNPNYPGVNCGQCEKCIRTMLGLLALGVLDQTRAFPHDISPEVISKGVRRKNPFRELCYQEVIPLLAERGRHDLVRAIEHKFAHFQDREPGWKGRIRRFDRKYFNGNIVRLKRLVLDPIRR